MFLSQLLARWKRDKTWLKVDASQGLIQSATLFTFVTHMPIWHALVGPV